MPIDRAFPRLVLGLVLLGSFACNKPAASGLGATPSASASASAVAPRPVLEAHLEHSASVTAAALSPDGKLLVTGDEDGVIHLWLPETSDALGALYGHRTAVTALTFSKDGNLLASAGGRPFSGAKELVYQGKDPGELLLWDVPGRSLRRSLPALTSSPVSIAFSPDAGVLCASTSAGIVSLFDAQSGKAYWSSPVQGKPGGGCAFSPDGRTLATVSENLIRLWSLPEGAPGAAPTQKQELKSHKARVNDVAFSPDGKRLASASDDKTVKLWDLASGEAQRTLDALKRPVRQVSFADDGRTIVAGATNLFLGFAEAYAGAELALWMADSGELRWRWQSGSGGLATLEVAPSSNTLVAVVNPVFGSSSWAGALLLDTERGVVKSRLGQRPASISDPVFSADDRFMALCMADSGIWLWDTTTAIPTARLPGDSCWGSKLALSPDGKTVLAVGRDGSTSIWSVEARRVTRSFAGPTDVRFLALSPDGTRLALATGHDVKLVDLTGKELGRLVHQDDVGMLAFSKDGSTLASVTDGNAAVLWDVATGKRKRALTLGPRSDLSIGTTIYADGSMVYTSKVVSRPFVDLSADGQSVVTSPMFETATASATRVWDAKSGAVLGNFTGSRARFSGEGKLLLTDRHSVSEIEIGSGKEAVKLEEARYPVASPTGRLIATRGADAATIKFWNAGTGKLRATLVALTDPGDPDRALEWVVHTPDSYLVASQNAGHFLRWRVGSSWAPFARFAAEHESPAQVALALGR